MIAIDILPILLGGGHEIAWANYQGIAAACPDKKITVINFDAHFDLRPLLDDNKGSSGTSFTQISNRCTEESKPFDYVCLGIQEMSNTSILFETAEQLKVKVLLADEFHLGGVEPALEFLNEVLKHSEMIHLTICLDVFASAFAPGVSAPQSLGLFPWQIIPLLQRLAASGKVISIDIAELCPPRDINGNTAHLAAALVYQFLNHYHIP
jgi:formiminoglutamase